MEAAAQGLNITHATGTMHLGFGCIILEAIYYFSVAVWMTLFLSAYVGVCADEALDDEPGGRRKGSRGPPSPSVQRDQLLMAGGGGGRGSDDYLPLLPQKRFSFDVAGPWDVKESLLYNCGLSACRRNLTLFFIVVTLALVTASLFLDIVWVHTYGTAIELIALMSPAHNYVDTKSKKYSLWGTMLALGEGGLAEGANYFTQKVQTTLSPSQALI